MKYADGTVTQGPTLVDVMSDRLVALVWRCLDGFDGWQTRRVAIRRIYGVDGRTLRDIGVNRSDVNSVVFGNAPGRRRIDAKH